MLFYLGALCGLIGFPLEIKALSYISFTCMGILVVYIYALVWKVIVKAYKNKEWVSAIIGTIFATLGVIFIGCMLSDVIWICPCW